MTGALLIPVDVGLGVIENVQQGTPTKRVVSDAIVDTVFGLVEWGLSLGLTGVVSIFAGKIPNPYAAGAVLLVADIVISIGVYLILEVFEFNGTTIIDWVTDRFYEDFFE